MANDDRDRMFRASLDKLRGGSVRDFLQQDVFPEWVELASAQILQQVLANVASTEQKDLKEIFGFYRPIRSLARRLILTRDAKLFSTLRPLWLAFGSSDADCRAVLNAIEVVQNDWPSEICDGTAGLQFSSAHAEFIKSMRQVGISDSIGVLGWAIRESRISDERSHAGFPMVQTRIVDSNLRGGIWITPTEELPQYECQSLKVAWDAIVKSVQCVCGISSEVKPLWLPTLLHRLVDMGGWPVATLESAGLGLAMQLLARRAGHDLPFGIGFTGRWKDGQLAGVRGLAAKAIAAKEAGVFVLFVCRDPEEPEPPQTEGVRVVLLPQGLQRDEVVRLVNRVCADSGLTEYRWRKAESRFRAASPASTEFTPEFRDAIHESRCPFGFIGREQHLIRLQQEITAQSTGRPLIAVIAPPRSGKTTLLSRFASQQLPYPIWFSFRRGQATRQFFAQLQESVRDQIASRFVVLRLPVNQTVPVESTPPPLEKALLDSVTGRIDLVVDGLDEIASLDESLAVLSWLQQLPGEGVVVVGSQSIPAINTVDCTKIALRNDSASGLADARLLITRCANRFAEHEHLQGIARHLSQPTWIDGLVERSGGNLWVLTEFLSAVEKDQAGWPSTPNEAPLSPNVREYCQKLVSMILTGYDDKATRALVEVFLAFRSFLGDQPWNVTDVVALADSPLTSAPFGTWSGTGVLAGMARRVIHFDGHRCQFWSPLTREAFRKHYLLSDAGAVAARFIARIGENQSGSEFSKHLLETIPMLLAEVRDPELVHQLLFSTSWLHRRMRMLAAQGQPMATLQAELQALKQIDSDCRPALRQMIDWLVGWGWAINDSRELIDQWWDSAAIVTGLFPRFAGAPGGTTDHCRLLSPIVGPTVDDRRYEIPWPAKPDFHPATCEMRDEVNRRLVFTTQPGDLLIYRDKQGQYVRERFIRLDEREKVFDLAPLSYPEVAALIRLRDGGCELRAIDIESTASRSLIIDSQIQSVASLATQPPSLLVISAEPTDGAPSSCRLRILGSDGNECAECGLPFVQSASADVEVIPYGRDCWCVLGRREARAPKEMRLYRLSKTSGSISIVEIQIPAIHAVHGACALPNHQLAVTHGGDGSGQNALSLIDSRGTAVLHIPLYTGSSEEPRRFSVWPDTPEAVLPRCKPVSWHASLGILLANEHDRAVFSVQPKPEAIPRELPLEVAGVLGTGDSTTKRVRILSMADGRALFVFSAGAVVLGPNPLEVVRIEGGARTRITPEIIGVRADGNVIICSGYVNPNNEWSRDSYRTDVPHFLQQMAETTTRPSDCVVVTHDGWELEWSRYASVLTGRKQAGEPAFCWDAAAFFGSNTKGETRIHHAIGCQPQGRAWVAVTHGRQVYAVLLPLPPNESQPRVQTIWTEMGNEFVYVQFLSASGNIVVYKVFNDSHQFRYDTNSCLCVLELDGSTYWPCCAPGLGLHFDTAIYLANGMSFVLIGEQYAPAIALVYSPQSGLEFLKRHVEFSCEMKVLQRLEGPLDSSVRIACIVQRDGRWQLEESWLTIRDEDVVLQSTASTEIAGEVYKWFHSEDYVALAYASGRIEVRRCDSLRTVTVIGYTPSPPDDLIMVRRQEGTFVVVSAGELMWYGPLC